MSSSWFEQLEAQLERQLEAFLSSHPEQQELLAEEEQRERQQRLRQRKLEIQQQAETQRQALLSLATEISQWQGRVERARAAGAEDLAGRAEAHHRQLMAQGRDRWQALSELGIEFRRVEVELSEMAGAGPKEAAGAGSSRTRNDPVGIEREWAEFEAQQELEELRRRRSGPGA
jgi:hercynine metabolism protein